MGTFKTHNGYGFLDVPSDASGIFLKSRNGINAILYRTGNTADRILLPKGQWSILGLAKDLGEQDWKGIVEKYHLDEKFRDYKEVEHDMCAVALPMLDTATASGLSLLKSLGLKDNVLILKQV